MLASVIDCYTHPSYNIKIPINNHTRDIIKYHIVNNSNDLNVLQILSDIFKDPTIRKDIEKIKDFNVKKEKIESLLEKIKYDDEVLHLENDDMDYDINVLIDGMLQKISDDDDNDDSYESFIQGVFDIMFKNNKRKNDIITIEKSKKKKISM